MHDPRPATAIRTASKIAPSSQQNKHLFFARNRPLAPLLLPRIRSPDSFLSFLIPESCKSARSFTISGSQITNLTIRSVTYVVSTIFLHLPRSAVVRSWFSDQATRGSSGTGLRLAVSSDPRKTIMQASSVACRACVHTYACVDAHFICRGFLPISRG